MNFKNYLQGMNTNATVLIHEEIEKIESEISFLFPNDYRDFLMTINGSEGLWGGRNYAIIWSGNDLGKYNKEYQVAEFLDNMLLIGSDGGGEAFAFDRLNNLSIVKVPFIGMRRDLATPIAKTFSEFIELLCEADLYE